ncbi:MAG: FAD binding domain-containing protein [Candidatus Aminicenantales bacterium]
MSLLDIKLHRPQSVAQAVKLLSELEDARCLAGGTDLLVDIKDGLVHVKNLVSLQDIRELRTIDAEDTGIRIGALVTPEELIKSPVIQEHFPVLGEAASLMGSAEIRSMATVGGNIASAVPSADLPPCLIAAEATVTLDCGSPREVPLLEFFKGPRETVCGGAEILTSVWLPFPQPRTGMSYQKFSLREANALAVVGVASRITLEEERIAKALVVLGAVAPTPVLAEKASGLLIGRGPSERLFEEAASAAREDARPITDIRGSLWYRKELIEVLTRRSLEEALARARRCD